MKTTHESISRTQIATTLSFFVLYRQNLELIKRTSTGVAPFMIIKKQVPLNLSSGDLVFVVETKM